MQPAYRPCMSRTHHSKTHVLITFWPNVPPVPREATSSVVPAVPVLIRGEAEDELLGNGKSNRPWVRECHARTNHGQIDLTMPPQTRRFMSVSISHRKTRVSDDTISASSCTLTDRNDVKSVSIARFGDRSNANIGPHGFDGLKTHTPPCIQ